MIQVHKHISKTFGELTRREHSQTMYYWTYIEEDTLRYYLNDIRKNTLSQEQRNAMSKASLCAVNVRHPIATQMLILTRMRPKEIYKE